MGGVNVLIGVSYMRGINGGGNSDRNDSFRIGNALPNSCREESGGASTVVHHGASTAVGIFNSSFNQSLSTPTFASSPVVKNTNHAAQVVNAQENKGNEAEIDFDLHQEDSFYAFKNFDMDDFQPLFDKLVSPEMERIFDQLMLSDKERYQDVCQLFSDLADENGIKQIRFVKKCHEDLLSVMQKTNIGDAEVQEIKQIIDAYGCDEMIRKIDIIVSRYQSGVLGLTNIVSLVEQDICPELESRTQEMLEWPRFYQISNFVMTSWTFTANQIVLLRDLFQVIGIGMLAEKLSGEADHFNKYDLGDLSSDHVEVYPAFPEAYFSGIADAHESSDSSDLDAPLSENAPSQHEKPCYATLNFFKDVKNKREVVYCGPNKSSMFGCTFNLNEPGVSDSSPFENPELPSVPSAKDRIKETEIYLTTYWGW